MREDPKRYVLLFCDEASFYRHPTQAWLWARLGRQYHRLRYSHRSNTRMRVLAYLNAHSGAVHGEHMSKVSVARLARSLSKLSGWYPEAECIYLVWDNWPVHKHERVRRALAQQPRVQVLWLPTYAPWLNPIEKVWRYAKDRVTHAHPWCDDFNEFKDQVRAELQQHEQGSPELLRYVGLST